MFKNSIIKATAFILGIMCVIPSAGALPHRHRAGGKYHHYHKPSSFKKFNKKWCNYCSRTGRTWKLNTPNSRIKLIKNDVRGLNLIANLHCLDKSDQEAIVKDVFYMHYHGMLPAEVTRIHLVVGSRGHTARPVVDNLLQNSKYSKGITLTDGNTNTSFSSIRLNVTRKQHGTM